MHTNTMREQPDFTSVRLTRTTTRIRDRFDSLAYLVEGTDRSILVDTACGVGDLGSFVRELTDKPVTVLLTHGHFDHTFGAGWFDDVRMNPEDRPVVEAHRTLGLDAVEKPKADGLIIAPLSSADDFGPLAAGEVFRLGGVTVRTISASGHTPGSLAFLIAEERVLITGDAANQFTFMFGEEAATVTQFQNRLRTLGDEAAGLYDRVYISHGTGDAPIDIIDQLDTLCSRVLAGTDDAEPFEFLGMKGLLARIATAPGFVDDKANMVYRPDPAQGIGAP